MEKKDENKKREYVRPTATALDTAFAQIEPMGKSWCYASESK